MLNKAWISVFPRQVASFSQEAEPAVSGRDVDQSKMANSGPGRRADEKPRRAGRWGSRTKPGEGLDPATFVLALKPCAGLTSRIRPRHMAPSRSAARDGSHSGSARPDLPNSRKDGPSNGASQAHGNSRRARRPSARAPR